MCNNPRHSIFCILPPHILSNIARYGSSQEREFALKTLAADQTMRTNRLTFSLLGGLQAPHPGECPLDRRN